MRQPTPDISLVKVVKQVDVSVTTINIAGSPSTVVKASVGISGTQSIWIIYDKSASSVSATLSIGTLNSAEYYTNACLLNITHTGTTEITVTGNELTLSTSIVTTVTGESDGEVIKVNSPLIDTTSLANSVGSYLVSRYTERNILSVEWRGNPALTLGDIIDVETHFSTTEDKRIVKQSYEYNGGLKSRLEVIG